MVITDKDGGLAVELRAPHGDVPVFLSASGDRTIWNEVINLSQSGDNTVHTPASGKKFYITDIFFTVRAAGGILLKSGSGNNISGQLMFSANGLFRANHQAQLQSRNASDAFVMNVSGDALIPIVGGYVLGYDE